jgi:hypothetical protein
VKRSAKVMAFVLACAVTPVIVPQASAQTQLANPGTPPAATQIPQQPPPAQQQKNSQGTANRAKGAAAGAATTGNAAAGAVVGIPVARRGGPTGTASNTYRICMP